MKKILVLGLMFLTFVAVQFVAPMTAPIDDDVGICYVMSADQIQPDMNIAIDNSSPLYFSDYAVPFYADVGAPACIINDSQATQRILWQSSKSTIVKKIATNQPAIEYEGLLRTDTGDIFSPDRAMSRHT